MRWGVSLVLWAVACSASPSLQDTCEPHSPELAVCCLSCETEDLDLSARVWGAYEDCTNPDAIQIDAVDVPCNDIGYLGCAQMGGDWVQYRVDGPHVPITIAHEIGHCLGHVHDPAPCTLMNDGSALSYSCGTVVFEGCNYGHR